MRINVLCFRHEARRNDPLSPRMGFTALRGRESSDKKGHLLIYVPSALMSFASSVGRTVSDCVAANKGANVDTAT